jgi:calcineurin-like phosphoesterase family protein
MTVFFTADTHFGHGAARAFYRRPFATVAEMDAAMADRWNATVGPDDDVWHLGDFAVRHKAPGALLDRLHGRKHLIAGNNDPPAIASLPGWTSVAPYMELNVDGTPLVLCHYAFRTWRDMAKGALSLHGHSHGRLRPQLRQFDVGVDVWDFRPVTLADLKGARR